MPTYIALLRGINVGGHKLIKMSALTTSLQTCGMGEARTYLQSGNAVFTARKAKTSTLAERIAAQIQTDFGFEVTVVVKTAAELQAAFLNNPFLTQPEIDLTTLHLTFLAGPPATNAAERLQTSKAAVDEFRLVGTELYLHCPAGLGKSKFSPVVLERACAVATTTRNWNTVTALAKLTGES